MTFAHSLGRAEPTVIRSLGRHASPLALLLLICLGLFLPGFTSMQPMDRDEPSFAQATKQMLETGDFVDIRFQDDARNKKPVGVYWLQAAAVTLAERLGLADARTEIWVYRIPSLLGAIAAVLLTYWAALAFGSSRMAFLAALLFASTILIGVEARLAKTDAIMTATVVACLGAMARVYLSRFEGLAQKRLDARGDFINAAIFWTAIGIGILIKGPITPMVPALAAVVLGVTGRSWRWLLRLRPGLGLLWCVALAAPWFILIMLRTHGQFLNDSLGGDMLKKVGSGQQLHGAPPGTYLLAFFATGWPMAPLAALAAFAAWRQRTRPVQAFLIAWIVPSWLVFELVPTKLPHYVLPLYPAIAIATALAITESRITLEGVGAWMLRLVPIILFAVLAAVGVASFYLGPPGPAFFITLPFILWFSWRIFRLPGRGTVERAVAECAVLSFLLAVTAYDGLLSADFFAPFRLSPRLVAAEADALAANPSCRRLDAAAAGYAEPSLVLMTSTDIRLTDGAGAGGFLAGEPCRIAFVVAQDDGAFRAALGNPDWLVSRPHVEGINLNGGKKLDFAVYLHPGGPPA